MSSEPLDSLNDEGLEAAARHLRRIIENGDTQAFVQFLHPNFIINGPNNRCASRDQVVQLFGAGAMAHEKYESSIESAALTGNVGIIMGNEVVTPAQGSPLATWFGKEPLRRRFTDVYLFESGRWLFLARQASVVREAG